MPHSPAALCPPAPPDQNQRAKEAIDVTPEFTYQGTEQEGEGQKGVLERQTEKSSTVENIIPPGSLKASGHPYKGQVMVTANHTQ